MGNSLSPDTTALGLHSESGDSWDQQFEHLTRALLHKQYENSNQSEMAISILKLIISGPLKFQIFGWIIFKFKSGNTFL